MSGWDDSPKFAQRRGDIEKALKPINATVNEIVAVSKRHNGWRNYETWAVKLWMDNDKSSYDFWNERAQEAYATAEPQYKWQTRKERAAVILSEAIKEYLEEANPVGEAAKFGLFSDLMSSAIGEVDCYEIATSLLEEIGDEANV